MDKRAFHVLLNELKDQNPDSFDLLESIQGTFEKEVEAISDSERRALKTFPVQFIPRIPTDRGEWTTKLHIWAENGIADILSVNPLMLAHKNSYGDTVLMCLISAATGTFTEVVNYDLIKKILNTDFSYEEKESTPDKEKVIIKNVIESGTDSVVVTGGEPLMWNLDLLCTSLKKKNQSMSLMRPQKLAASWLITPTARSLFTKT